MTASATALLGLVAWTMVLTLVLLSARTAAMMKGHPVNTFTQDGSELPALSQRATRAHGNSLEWLVLPVAVLGYAIMSGQTAVTDGLAMIFLGARVLQSVAHHHLDQHATGAAPCHLLHGAERDRHHLGGEAARPLTSRGPAPALASCGGATDNDVVRPAGGRRSRPARAP